MNSQFVALAAAGVLGLVVGAAQAVPVWDRDGTEPVDGHSLGQANGPTKKLGTLTIGPHGSGEIASFCDRNPGATFCDRPGERNAYGKALAELGEGKLSLRPGNAGNTGPDMIPNPLPGAVWLFGSALVGLVALNRRRKMAA